MPTEKSMTEKQIMEDIEKRNTEDRKVTLDALDDTSSAVLSDGTKLTDLHDKKIAADTADRLSVEKTVRERMRSQSYGEERQTSKAPVEEAPAKAATPIRTVAPAAPSAAEPGT